MEIRPEPSNTQPSSGGVATPAGAPARAAASIAVITLGCPKNLVDSESMLGSLHRAGYPVARDPADADLVVVNTCAFLTASQEESIETILEMAALKETGRLRRLVVAGCLAQRHGEGVLHEIPEVDYLIGTGSIDQVVAIADGLLADSLERGAQLGGLESGAFAWEPRVLSGMSHCAYLKISEGCNNTCSFCIIPQLRGKHRSRPIDDIVAEATRLVGAGVRELIVVAQDTTSYGLDLYRRFALPELLQALDRIEGLRWVRLLYTYPRYWTEALVDSLGTLQCVAPYIDMPIQHASDPVLKRMRRGANWATTRGWLERIRAAAPDMVLRTTVITGFPGETEEEFAELKAAVADVEFDHLGAFAYSTEDGTPAGALGDQVPQEIREDRRNQIMELQRGISLRRNRALLGRELEVLIDEVDVTGSRGRGRWSGQAPEIDGHVAVRADDLTVLAAGQFVRVRIEAAGPYDLGATVLPASESLPMGSSWEFSC